MPGGDRTGPAGLGPMTGRAMGSCAGYAAPGYVNPIVGRGFGVFGRRGGGAFGRGGGGWGWRNRFYATGLVGWQRAGLGMPAYGVPPMQAATYSAPLTPAVAGKQELDVLKGQAEYFEDALEGIKKRIEELQAQISETAE
ncbi:MAG: DUF5320 domain-containing protein [Phycisphaerae bacterium]|nr:DUF5320 domain-containing protein [Phycisphaerae bacterium]